MNITWGHKVTFAFLAFAVFILYMVSKMLNTQVDLVEKDYYAKELQFQNQINKHNNMLALGDSAVIISQDEHQIKIEIKDISPEKINLYFYYPADIKNDTSLFFQKQNLIMIDKKYLKKGKTKLKIEWKDTQKEYYYEKELLIY